MKRTSCGRGAALLAFAMLIGLPTASCADLSLQDAIDLALAQNTGLRITQKDEDVAKAALKQAKIDNGLKITGNESLDTTLHRSSHTKSENGIGVTASYPIYTSGKAEAAIDSSELGLKAAELSTERSRENLKLDVIKAYYDALEARRTVDVRQETVDKYQDHYTNVSQLYAAGSKARIDVIRSSVELSNAAQNLIKAQNSYEVNLATLRNYLNVDRSEPLNLTSDFSYDQFNIDMDACIDYAYRNRKDLLIDLYKYQQAENDIKAAKADFGPSVTLSADPSWSHTFKPSTSFDSDITAGATLSWNFWDNGLTRAKVQQAEASRDKAKLTLTKDQEDIDLSLRQAYYNMREAEKRLNSTGDAVKQAEEDYFIAREKYRAGEGLMLDIIDAQEALSTARLNYISAEYDYARYKATVENAMGIGLTDGEKEAVAKMTATEVPAEQVERAVLQEPVVPENAKARVDKETKGLAKKKADKKKAAAAAASDASAEVIHDLAEGEITK
ncbi:TolC family protein [Mitsuokella jalaludinii]|uniref:TolC family protein n=1 Tax=Mitsuokella jalaludinii TaxID=187979 RepID=UPI00307A47E2